MNLAPLDWLYSTQWFGVKPGLDNTRRLLREAMAMPAHGVKVLHVAGTNGKGSVCAMADSIARACGIRTGLFTSPHLVDYRERIRVDGEMIPPNALDAELDFLRRLVARWDPHPTFFELSLIAALRHFKDRGCELLVLETGMGGRLDATNAVPSDVSVLTPIGMDHAAWLGDTIAKIAAEKAGILKPGVPVFSAAQEPDARAVIEQTANMVRAPLKFIEEPLAGYPVALPGRHQRHNAALAVEALHALRVPLRVESLQFGLANTRWPGRFDRRPAHRLILDGAHNPAGAATLVQTWHDWMPGQLATLLFSALQDKDAAGLLATLRPLAARLIVCPIDSPRASTPDALSAAAASAGYPPEMIAMAPSLANALAIAAKHPETTLVTGSLHFIGQAIAMLDGDKFQSSAQ